MGRTSTKSRTSTVSCTQGIAQPRLTSDGRRQVLCIAPSHNCTNDRRDYGANITVLLRIDQVVGLPIPQPRSGNAMGTVRKVPIGGTHVVRGSAALVLGRSAHMIGLGQP